MPGSPLGRTSKVRVVSTRWECGDGALFRPCREQQSSFGLQMMVFDQNQYLVGWHIYDQNKYLVLRDASVMVNGASMMVNHIFSVIRNGVCACLQAIRSGAEKLSQKILLRLQHTPPGTPPRTDIRQHRRHLRTRNPCPAWASLP